MLLPQEKAYDYIVVERGYGNFVCGEYTLALLLASELADLRAGYANPCVCRANAAPKAHGNLNPCTREFRLTANIFARASCERAPFGLLAKCEPMRLRSKRWFDESTGIRTHVCEARSDPYGNLLRPARLPTRKRRSNVSSPCVGARIEIFCFLQHYPTLRRRRTG